MPREVIALMPSDEWACAPESRSSRPYSSQGLRGRLVAESNRSADAFLENGTCLHIAERTE